MASNPDVFLQGLIGTTGLRPIQDVQQGQQQLQIGQQQIQANQQINQARQLAMTQAQQQAAREAALQHDTQEYFANPSPANLAALVKKYPEQAEQLQKTYDVLDAPAKQSRIQQLGSLYNAARNNRPELVAKTMQSIIDAEKAQGIDTSDAEDALAALNSGDPKALTYVTAFAQAHLAAADKDFAKTLGIGADQKNFTSTGDGAIYDQRTGEITRPAPVKPIYKTVDVFDEEGNKVGTQVIEISPGGGDPASTAGGGAASPTAPRSGPRSVRNNNPGNIKGVNDSGQPIAWVQKLPGYQGVDDKGYAIFADSNGGQTAQRQLLGRYMAGGRRSVSAIIEKWAPRQSNGGDNTDAQVDNYIASVAKQLNVNPKDTLSEASIPALAAAMARFESGGRGGATRSSPSNPSQAQPSGARTVYSSVGAKPNDGGLSPEEVNYYAQQVAGGAPLPTLGMGKDAARIRQQILARAADINIERGIGGMQANLLHADLKANTHSLSVLANLQNQVAASERTASANAEQVLKLGPSGAAGGAPVFNRWIQAGRSAISGDPAVSAYNAAITTFANEYAKVMTTNTGSGGVTSDSARKEAESLINNAQTFPQVQAVIHQMRVDMANRSKALETQRQILSGQISGGGSSGNAPHISTRQEYDRLPSGAHYIDPTGQPRVKR